MNRENMMRRFVVFTKKKIGSTVHFACDDVKIHNMSGFVKLTFLILSFSHFQRGKLPEKLSVCLFFFLIFIYIFFSFHRPSPR